MAVHWIVQRCGRPQCALAAIRVGNISNQSLYIHQWVRSHSHACVYGSSAPASRFDGISDGAPGIPDEDSHLLTEDYCACLAPGGADVFPPDVPLACCLHVFENSGSCVSNRSVFAGVDLYCVGDGSGRDKATPSSSFSRRGGKSERAGAHFDHSRNPGYKRLLVHDPMGREHNQIGIQYWTRVSAPDDRCNWVHVESPTVHTGLHRVRTARSRTFRRKRTQRRLQVPRAFAGFYAATLWPRQRGIAIPIQHAAPFAGPNQTASPCRSSGPSPSRGARNHRYL